MNQFCQCCCYSNCCKPRYKRLIDNVYPPSAPFDSPIASNMQKLTFYSISHPEKLNRIGQYLVQRQARNFGRQRMADAKVAVDAMENLLKSCHASPSLNQFIESYLLMVQRLLETNDPKMENMATDSFVRFSGIEEEDSPSYHRQYDFFISKFSSMCHNNQGAYLHSRRFNGLRGLRGVIWKLTSSDDLQTTNIWENHHLNKIVPSILFNLQNENNDESDQFDDLSLDASRYHHYPEEESVTELGTIKSLALQCLRELFQKCNFGSLKSLLLAMFKHFDSHSKWNPPPMFAIKTFRAILYIIPSHNFYFFIQELINYMEKVPNNEVQIRIGMATVLANIVCIVGSSIGPLLLAIFNALLKLLHSSIEFQQSEDCTNLEAEKHFQDTLINAMSNFMKTLPEYHKVEINMFLYKAANTIPNILDSNPSTGDISNKLMQIVDGDFLQKLLKKAKGEINNINKQNSVDDIDSIESTISGNGVVDDWSPTVSNVHSRQNTFYEEGERQQQEKENLELLPLTTVDQLRILANMPLDLNEEDREDQEKSRKVLELFRGKDANQLLALFRKNSFQRRCSSSSICSGDCMEEDEWNSTKITEEKTLAQTLLRLNARHDEETKILLFGQQAQPATIFEIKFPSSFEFY